MPESPARVQLGGSLRQGLLALLRSVATPTDTAASATTCLEAYACVADVDADEPELMPALTGPPRGRLPLPTPSLPAISSSCPVHSP